MALTGARLEPFYIYLFSAVNHILSQTEKSSEPQKI
jgi:hypothetical protein